MTKCDLESLLKDSGVPAARAREWAEPLANAMAKADINTPLRVGHFLAQLYHESVLLKYRQEIWGPTPAQRRYEGRRDLGNTQKGDGYLFRGRGPIQLTGRANYTAFNVWLKAKGYNADVVRNPNLVAMLDYGTLAATWFWERNKLNRYADGGDDVRDVRAVTRVINGGYNGIADRINYFVKVMIPIRKMCGYKSDTQPL